jgi:hypothetical protein
MMADLAEDPAKLQAFKNDRDTVMDEYQLTEDQKRVFTSGNQEDFIRTIMDEHNLKFWPFGVDFPCF